jgi:hypothetical protein
MDFIILFPHFIQQKAKLKQEMKTKISLFSLIFTTVKSFKVEQGVTKEETGFLSFPLKI